MENILQIKSLHKSFVTGYIGLRQQKEFEVAEVLQGLSMEVQKGTVTAILGSNGSGKSTLFNIISGLLKPDKGEVLYNYNSKQYNLTRLPSFRHASIGVARLFQGANIFSNLSVIDNMMLADDSRVGEQPWDYFIKPGSVKRQEKIKEEKAHYILSQLLGQQNSLWDKRKDTAGSLSLGQQRLLAFARLLMNSRAEIFLLDEPCAGVNIAVRELMLSMIENLTVKGKTTLLIEHDMEFAKRCARQSFYLESGRIIAQGSIVDILNNTEVRKNYLSQNA